MNELCFGPLVSVKKMYFLLILLPSKIHFSYPLLRRGWAKVWKQGFSVSLDSSVNRADDCRWELLKSLGHWFKSGSRDIFFSKTRNHKKSIFRHKSKPLFKASYRLSLIPLAKPQLRDRKTFFVLFLYSLLLPGY